RRARRVAGRAVALRAVSCSSPAPPQSSASARPDDRLRPTQFSIVTRGEPFALRFEDGALTFCDGRGVRRLDLKSGVDAAVERACTDREEPNTACHGLSLDADVRAPLSEPDDIVDVDGWSVPLKGRVRDCAASGKALAIVTGAAVVVVDAGSNTTRELSAEGGDRVAIAPRWVAWSNGSALRVVSAE